MASVDRPLTWKDLVRDLESVGVKVASVWDLVDTAESYPEAVPVLISWLSKVHSMAGTDNDRSRMLEGLARALTVREARPAAAPALIRNFLETNDPTVQWAIGSALEVVADRSSLNELLDIAQDRRYGTARQLVVTALGRIGRGRPEVTTALLELLDDDDVVAFAVSALASLRAVEARPNIEQLVNHSRPLVRNHAKSALRKIDKVAAAQGH
jgi:hypothetical protein